MGSKKGCISIPLHLRGKSTNRFCLFPKVRSESLSPGNTPVYLNVYDLTPMNGYMYWTGLGIFHSGVEGIMDLPLGFLIASLLAMLHTYIYLYFVVLKMDHGLVLRRIHETMDKIINGYFSWEKGGHVHGVEYAFGAHDYSTSGVFEVEPRHCPGFKFRKSIFMGTTSLDPVQVREFMERHSANYNGDTYHLIVKNCNHFCKDICDKLTGNTIPKWVNRLARIGSLCNCVLPEALRVAAVRDDPNDQSLDSEKRRLRSAFSCMSSISIKQKHMSTSSLFIPSPLKGCPPPKDLRKPTSAPVEKEA